MTAKNKVKPKKIDSFTYLCPICGTKVGYAKGTGHIFVGASESYEDWHFKKHRFCPECGAKLEWSKQ